MNENWSGRGDSNSRPPAPKAGALTKLRYSPEESRYPTTAAPPPRSPVAVVGRSPRYTPGPVKSSVQPDEGNKVRLSVEVDADEFESALEDAFRKIAREVRVPGFRPGRVPRKVLEARIGTDVARGQALQDGIPDWYVAAVKEHDVDVIAAPEIDITSGQEEGPVAFDAIVEVRPEISVGGYESLQVTIPAVDPTDDEIEAQIERLRSTQASFEPVDRPAAVGDTAVIDIAGELDGEPAPGLTAQEYSYEVGSGGIVEEVDAQLTGASAGDELSFDAKHPVREDATLQFEIVVREVRERILPEADDAFAAEVSEFETLAELRDDLVDRARRVRRAQAAALVRERTGEAIAALVIDDVPDALVDSELNQRLQDMTMRLQAQGIDLGTWLAMQNRDPEEFVAELRSSADGGAKLDLALRAIATAEGIEVTDADLDQEWADVAERVGVSADEVRERFEATEQVGDVRVDIVKRKAFDWVSERVTIVDESGTIIDRASLDAPEPGTVSDEPVETAGTTDADDAADDSKGDDE